MLAPLLMWWMYMSPHYVRYGGAWVGATRYVRINGEWVLVLPLV